VLAKRHIPDGLGEVAELHALVAYHAEDPGQVVVDSGRVLAIRRPEDGRWEPPGSLLELGETILDGVRREAREETGLHVQPQTLGAVYKNMTTSALVLTFRCHVLGGSLTPNDEASEFRWMTPDEVRQHMPEIFAQRVLDALADGPPAVRTHDGLHITGNLGA
jgi:8-oxo-dGTP diphosphatase